MVLVDQQQQQQQQQRPIIFVSLLLTNAWYKKNIFSRKKQVAYFAIELDIGGGSIIIRSKWYRVLAVNSDGKIQSEIVDWLKEFVLYDDNNSIIIIYNGVKRDYFDERLNNKKTTCRINIGEKKVGEKKGGDLKNTHHHHQHHNHQQLQTTLSERLTIFHITKKLLLVLFERKNVILQDKL